MTASMPQSSILTFCGTLETIEVTARDTGPGAGGMVEGPKALQNA